MLKSLQCQLYNIICKHNFTRNIGYYVVDRQMGSRAKNKKGTTRRGVVPRDIRAEILK